VVERDWTCACRCGESVTVRARAVWELDDTPSAELLATNRFHREGCKACGAIVGIDVDFLVIGPGRLFQVVGADTDVAATVLSIRRIAPNVPLRIVPDRRALVEKIRLYQAGVDDVAFEIVKLLRRATLDAADPHVELRFERLEGDELVLSAFEAGVLKGVTRVPRSVLTSAMAKYDTRAYVHEPNSDERLAGKLLDVARAREADAGSGGRAGGSSSLEATREPARALGSVPVATPQVLEARAVDNSLEGYAERYVRALVRVVGGATPFASAREIGQIHPEKAAQPHLAVFLDLGQGRCIATTAGLSARPMPLPVAGGLQYFELCAHTKADSPGILWLLSNLGRYMLRVSSPIFLADPILLGDPPENPSLEAKPFFPGQAVVLGADRSAFLLVPRFDLLVPDGPSVEVIEPLPLTDAHWDELRPRTLEERITWARSLGSASATLWDPLLA